MWGWQVEQAGLGYTALLVDEDDESVVARVLVDNIQRNKGVMSATLTVLTGISTARKMGRTFVTNEFLTFTSGRQKREFAIRLDNLILPPPGGAHPDWDQLVEGLVDRVGEIENRPPPVRNLALVRARGPVSYLVDYLIPERRPTILYGAGGTGKSVFAACLATCVRLGEPFMDFDTRAANVLYLDWETTEEDVAANVAMAARGIGVPTPDVFYLSMIKPLEYRLPEISRIVHERQVELVIVDSATMASRAPKDGPEEAALDLFRSLRQLDCAALVLDHVTGEDMKRGSSAKPYGSVFKWNAARNAFEIRRSSRATSEADHRVTLTHRKSNLTRRIDDFDVRYQWGFDSIRLAKAVYYLT